MKNLVITMCDENYFENGKYFLKTRERVNADFILYTPSETGLSYYNRTKCLDYRIKIDLISQKAWDSSNQLNKLCLLDTSMARKYTGVTFCDFDTVFIADWNDEVFKHDFNIGITTTNGFPQWSYLRSKVNGGVIFAKPTKATEEIIGLAFKCIRDGVHELLPEYDTIWKTLEDPRRGEHKRHYRTNLNWWVDQVFLSALYLAKDRFPGVKDFPCSRFNVLDSAPDLAVTPGVYIKHLKAKHRPKKEGLISG